MSHEKEAIRAILEDSFKKKEAVWVEFEDGERKEGVLKSCRRRDEMAVQHNHIPLQIGFESEDSTFSSDLIVRAGTMQTGG
jgi:hypothetical protein